jgi:hypothetical protein
VDIIHTRQSTKAASQPDAHLLAHPRTSGSIASKSAANMRSLIRLGAVFAKSRIGGVHRGF